MFLSLLSIQIAQSLIAELCVIGIRFMLTNSISFPLVSYFTKLYRCVICFKNIKYSFCIQSLTACSLLATDLQSAVFDRLQTNLTAFGQLQPGISIDNGREEQLVTTE